MNNINNNIQKMRGIAILLIFFSHCTIFVGTDGQNLFKWFGAFGVELFIILSGYLAVNSYEHAHNIKQYYKRKISRFLPLHILTMIIAIPLSLPVTWKLIVKILLNTLMINVWFPDSRIYFSLNAVSWYLGITVWFILITPFCVILLKKVSKYMLPFGLIFIQLFEILIVYASGILSIDSHWVTYICPIVRSLDFLGGGILCMIVKNMYEYLPDKKIISVVGWLLGVIVMLISTQYNTEIFSACVWFLPSILIILGTTDYNSNKNNVFTKVGNISFEFFLIHQLVIRYIDIILNKLGRNNRIFILCISLGISLLVSMICNRILYNLFKNKKGAYSE